MAKRKFKPITGDLEILSKEDRDEYVLAACEHLNVPPELGLVGLRLMDSGGDGKRNLVLYVEKGATDIIRGNLGIDVESMVEVNGPGYVGWKAVGRDKTGRHEIAVGTVSIDGLRGVLVANAVMVAQTKSMRRMTLQFAGGGFLDITELGEKTTDIVNSAQSLAQIAAQPSVKTNTAAGKDVTEPATGIAPTLVNNVKPVDTVIATVLAADDKPARKPRRKKTVSIDLPVAQPPETSPAESGQEPATTPEVTSSSGNDQVQAPRILEATPVTPPVAPEEVPSDGGIAPLPEQKKAYRDRLSTYINQTLPPAGFLQSVKLGSRNDKMKLFIKQMFPKANTKALSVQQWDTLFEFLDGRIKSEGAEALVKFIDRQIGEEILNALQS